MKRKSDINFDNAICKKPKLETIEFAKLDNFNEFFSTGITNRKTLEEFCLQKMCEVLGQTSDLGGLRHEMALIEENFKSYKTKVETLTKQCRDLEIVKNKLIQDIRRIDQGNGSLKDLVPVKITRSVGLQVGIGNTLKPRSVVPQNVPQTPPSAPIQRKPKSQPNRTPVNSPIAKPPQKQIKTILPQKNPDPKPLDSILNKALQKSPPKKPEPPQKNVIDLTDEEDVTKRITQAPVQQVTSQASNIRVVPQVVSSASMPVVTTLVASNVVPGSRLTYVMNTNGHPTGQQLITIAPNGTPPRNGYKNVMLRPLTPNNIGK